MFWSSARSGFAIGMILCYLSCSVSNEERVTKEVYERDKDKDGVPDFRAETYFRGRQSILTVMETKHDADTWSTTRIYDVSEEQIVIEEDKDGDGIFETMIVLNPDQHDLEVFTKLQDGSVTIASREVKEAYQKMFYAIDTFWEEAFDAPNEKSLET